MFGWWRVKVAQVEVKDLWRDGIIQKIINEIYACKV